MAGARVAVGGRESVSSDMASSPVRSGDDPLCGQAICYRCHGHCQANWPQGEIVGQANTGNIGNLDRDARAASLEGGAGRIRHQLYMVPSSSRFTGR